MNNIKKIHFIGIGGSGMSGLAQVYHQLGFTISGSDMASNDTTRHLKDMGITIYQGHNASNANNVDLVIVSSAINPENPEIQEAQQKNIPIWHRSQLLMDLMSTREVIAVAGTHGKTTTSSMVFSMLLSAGLQPTAIIGGKVKEISSGASLGEGNWLVAEADESDKSFLGYLPRIEIINNIEADHLEHYDGKVENVILAFEEFTQKVHPDGWIIFGIDDTNAYNLAKKYKKKKLTFGFHKEAQIRAENIEMMNFNSLCDVYHDNKKLGQLELHLPGRHNIQNALAVVSVGIALNIPFEKIKRGLVTFGGVDRRFQKMGEEKGIKVYDDYAHNPAKVAAAISAAKTGNANRVIAVFQPHRFSRTFYLSEVFGKSFDLADLTVLTEIYSAGESPMEGVSSKNIYDAAMKHGYSNITYIPDRVKINDYLWTILKPGDLVIFMGAGDIWKIAEDLVNRLKKQDLPSQNSNNGLHLQGTVQKHVPMKKFTTLRVGGEADVFVTAESLDDLKEVCRYAGKKKLKLFVIGAGSNLLVKDEGIDGIVVKLGKEFGYKEKLDETRIKCGSAALLPQIARFSGELGLSGLEELVGIPASIGGALAMNAGAHGRAIGDLVESVRVVTFEGEEKLLPKNTIDFAYHTSNLKDVIIFEVILKLTPMPIDDIKKKIQHYLEIRNATQPVTMPSAGCIFRNPKVDGAGKWIDRAGMKGNKIGDALVSPKHANFFVNMGNARAEDFLKLIQNTKHEVKSKFDVDLDLEVRIVGRSTLDNKEDK